MNRIRIAAFIVLGVVMSMASAVEAATFTVNSTGDESDAKPGSGICGTLLGVNKTDPDRGPCTLRAAIEEANAFAGTDIIQFNIPASDPNCPSGVCTISSGSALPNLSTNIDIVGPGADKLIVRSGNGQSRIFNVTTASTVTFFGLTIRNGGAVNVPNVDGGGILNSFSATVNVTNCAITANHAGRTSGGGGGIYNSAGGTVNVTNCTISGNTGFLGAGGGGLYNANGGALNVTNSTISGNSVDDNNGGGIFMAGGTLNVTNSTISGNSTAGTNGGGIFSLGGTVNVKSTIIAKNTAATGGPDVSGAFTSFGFNLIGKSDDSTGFTAATDHTGTVASPLDPKLETDGMGKPLLKNNGGPTQTIVLLFGSPAIDKGTSAGLTGVLTTDQRGTGFVRPSDDPAIGNAGGDGTDIGSFEVQTVAPSPTPTPTATPTATPVTTLANIATRLRVETDDNVLIAGFIVTGTQQKNIIIRAIGTSLSLADKLQNPTLELRDSSGTLLDSNDNWVDSLNKQAIINSGLAPTNDLESAIIATVAANNSAYTGIVRGAANGTGIGVVEAYDLNISADSKLANISTRGLVQTGDNVLIAGMIVVGQSSQQVVIRAIGPSLSITGKMADPILELRDSNGGLVEASDNWVDSVNKQAIINSGLAPTNDLESAILATLSAGNAAYTAIVRGVNNTTGIAVVEVYALN